MLFANGFTGVYHTTRSPPFRLGGVVYTIVWLAMRETHYLGLLCQDLSMKVIAHQMGVAESSVRSLGSRLARNLDVYGARGLQGFVLQTPGALVPGTGILLRIHVMSAECAAGGCNFCRGIMAAQTPLEEVQA
jgi:DNA-binding CsgD family transcriptional regulator